MWKSLFSLLHTSFTWSLKVRFSSSIIPRNLICEVLFICWLRNSISFGMLGITFLLDLNIVKDDFSELRVSLFALNQLVSWVIIILPVDFMSSMELLWKNIVVSSANNLVLPSGQLLCRSFMNNIKKSGPSMEPWGTPQVIGKVCDLHLSICTYCLRLLR